MIDLVGERYGRLTVVSFDRLQNHKTYWKCVCEEWNDYAAFKAWAMSAGYADNLSIDRIDPNDDYCAKNCRWITPSENTARANKNHTSRKLIRGEGQPKVGQPQRIGSEKI